MKMSKRQHAYRLAGQRMYSDGDGISVEEDTRVTNRNKAPLESGAYVSAWIWISRQDLNEKEQRYLV